MARWNLDAVDGCDWRTVPSPLLVWTELGGERGNSDAIRGRPGVHPPESKVKAMAPWSALHRQALPAALGAGANDTLRHRKLLEEGPMRESPGGRLLIALGPAMPGWGSWEWIGED